MKNGERVGIEVETGKSDVVANVKNGLQSGFDQVLVVATDDGAFGRVETQLGRAGLIIPGRVKLILGDKRDAVDVSIAPGTGDDGIDT